MTCGIALWGLGGANVGEEAGLSERLTLLYSVSSPVFSERIPKLCTNPSSTAMNDGCMETWRTELGVWKLCLILFAIYYDL